jgi:Bacterial dnaA protein helix-turn-helix
MSPASCSVSAAKRCRSRPVCSCCAGAYRQGTSRAPLDLREVLESTVASGFDVEELRLRQPTRGVAQIALARQAAMYLAHVSCGLSKAAAGRLFGRDRTTVHHACIVIEQRRDDKAFDTALTHLEQLVRIVVGVQEVACETHG